MGGLLSAWAARSLRGYLYEITPYDISAWLVATIVVLVVTALGTAIPAVQASRVNPVTALRVE